MFNSYLKYLQTGGFDINVLNSYIKNEVNEKDLDIIYDKKGSFDLNISGLIQPPGLDTNVLTLENAKDICINYSHNNKTIFGKNSTDFNFIVSLKDPNKILLDRDETEKCIWIFSNASDIYDAALDFKTNPTNPAKQAEYDNKRTYTPPSGNIKINFDIDNITAINPPLTATDIVKKQQFILNAYNISADKLIDADNIPFNKMDKIKEKYIKYTSTPGIATTIDNLLKKPIFDKIDLFRVKELQNPNNILKISNAYDALAKSAKDKLHDNSYHNLLILVLILYLKEDANTIKGGKWRGGADINKDDFIKKLDKYYDTAKGNININALRQLFEDIGLNKNDATVNRILKSFMIIPPQDYVNKYMLTEQIVDYTYLEKEKYVIDDSVSLIPLKVAYKYSNTNRTRDLISKIIMDNLESAIISAFNIDILKLNMNKSIYSAAATKEYFEEYIMSEEQKDNHIDSLTGWDNIENNFENVFKYFYNKLITVIKSSLSFRDKINIICKNIETFKKLCYNDSKSKQDPSSDPSKPNGAKKENVNRLRYGFLNIIYLVINFEALLVLDIIMNRSEYAAENILPVLLDPNNYIDKKDYLKAAYIIRNLMYNKDFIKSYTFDNNTYQPNTNAETYMKFVDGNNAQMLHKAFIDGMNKALKKGYSNIATEIDDYVPSEYNKFEFNIRMPEAIPKVISDKNIGQLEINLLNPTNYYNTISTKAITLGGYEDSLLQTQHSNLLNIYSDPNKDDNIYNMKIWGTEMLLNCVLNKSENTDECFNALVNIGIKDSIINFLKNMKLETKIKILWSIGVKFNKIGNYFKVESYEDYKKRTNLVDDTPLKGGDSPARFYENAAEFINVQNKTKAQQERLLKAYIVHILIDSLMYNEFGKPRNYKRNLRNLRNDVTNQVDREKKNIFNLLTERNKTDINLINTKAPTNTVDIDAWLTYQSPVKGGEQIDGGGQYSEIFREYFKHYKKTLESMGYKLSSKDEKAFENALNRLENAEDALQNYFSQYKYVIDHYKDIKDKLSGREINESTLAELKKQLNEASNSKQKAQATVLKMMQITNQFNEIPGVKIQFVGKDGESLI